VDGVTVLVGNASLMERHAIDVSPLGSVAESLEEQGATAVYVAIASELAGVLGIADAVKPGSRAAIARMRALGAEVIMLTGDSERTARVVAREVGIDRVIAQVLPPEKARVVERLRAESGHVVAMVGDGVNDAPALARADIGMAIGTGTDVAAEASDVLLTGGDLDGVPTAIRISRSTLGVIRQNLFWAFFYNVLGIPVAAGILYPAFGVLLSPVFASAAMALSSVSVVANSLRLRKLARTA
jgi:Cu+-exporting ATPase